MISENQRVDASWRSWSGVHGGLLAGILLDQANRTVPHLVPRALHVSYLAAVRSDTMSVSADLVREGRTSATVRAEVRSDDRPSVIGTATFGTVGDGPEIAAEKAPSAPSPENSIPLPSPVELVPFTQYVEFRSPDGSAPMSGGAEPVLTAWVRMSLPLDSPAKGLAVLLDALAPALYAMRTTPVPVPSVEFAIHFTAAFAAVDLTGWNLVRIRTEHAGGGWCVDGSEVWSADGTLLATGRQSRRILL